MYISQEGEEETCTSLTGNILFNSLGAIPRARRRKQTRVKDVHNNTRRGRRDIYFIHREQPFPSSGAIPRARRNTTTPTTTMKNVHSTKKEKERHYHGCLSACLPVDGNPERKEWNKKARIKPEVSRDSI
jgi:hypothetical protein